MTRQEDGTLSSRDRVDTRPRVLLVEDAVVVRDALYTLLEDGGYEVLAANSGPAGLTAFRQSIYPVELLVTDYHMPGMSGVDLARECTQLNRELAVLYVSAGEPDADLSEDLRGRRRAFLGKPFRGADLLRKARELLLTDPVSPLRSSPRKVTAGRPMAPAVVAGIELDKPGY